MGVSTELGASLWGALAADRMKLASLVSQIKFAAATSISPSATWIDRPALPCGLARVW